LKASKIRGLKTIIAVDRWPDRISLAQELGATHGRNTTAPDFDLAKEVKGITGGYGTTITIDTTGDVKLMSDGVDATAARGQMIYIGASPAGCEPVVNIRQIQQVSP
jgi:Zn-dependent alcohol dehydrogenase